MIEQITDNGSIIATIIKAGFTKKGEQFFTPNEFSQQLGYMNRPKGYRVEAHTHKQVHQQVVLTQEVLYVKSGTIKVGLFTDTFKFIKECTLTEGDFILLASGGHSVEMMEDSEIIEVKQGPYSQENKVYFKPVQNA